MDIIDISTSYGHTILTIIITICIVQIINRLMLYRNKSRSIHKRNFPTNSNIFDVNQVISEHIDNGCLHVFVGPMFSGKTTELMRKISEYADCINSLQSDVSGLSSVCKVKPLLINHGSDTRDKTSVISSHSSQFKGISANVVSIYATTLADVDVSKYTVIGIDECQFFKDLLPTILLWVEAGKHVYCAGLDGTFESKPFGQSHLLVSLSDTFVKKNAICHVCIKERTGTVNVITPGMLVSAPFTAKTGNLDTKIEVGSKDIYLPLCRRHWNRYHGNMSNYLEL
jgi:thymidine kinase